MQMPKATKSANGKPIWIAFVIIIIIIALLALLALFYRTSSNIAQGNANIVVYIKTPDTFFYSLKLNISGNGIYRSIGINHSFNSSNESYLINSTKNNSTSIIQMTSEFKGLKPFSNYKITLQGAMGPRCYPGVPCIYEKPNILEIINETKTVKTGADGTTTYITILNQS